jgi:hypothetical protein
VIACVPREGQGVDFLKVGESVTIRVEVGDRPKSSRIAAAGFIGAAVRVQARNAAGMAQAARIQAGIRDLRVFRDR